MTTLGALLGRHLPRIGLATAASAAAELAGLGLTATAAWLITRASEQPGIDALSVAIVGVRAFAVFRGTLRYGERVAGHEAALRALVELRGRLYDALVPLLPGRARTARGGALLTHMVGDVEALQELILRVWIPAALQVLAGGAAIGLCWLLLPLAGAELAAGLLVSAALVPLLAGLSFRALAGAAVVSRAEVAERALDLLQGASDLAAFGATGEAMAAAERAGDRLARLERATAFRLGAADATRLAVAGATMLAIMAGAMSAAHAGRVAPILVPVLALTALAALEVAAPLTGAALRLVQSLPSLDRLSGVLAAPAPVVEPAAPMQAPAAPLELVVEGLRVRHAPGAAPALDGVDLRVAQGRRVALVGASGSGKTTLLSVLLRFVEIEAGRVTLNGVDVRRLAGDDVRRLMTGAIQDAHVFNTGLGDNLRLARPGASDQELRVGAARTRLLEWVETLPGGWDTMVGEDGRQLSGGQRQRLLLTQALLAGPPVLLLDEPTEGLDPATADAVLADLLAGAGDRTLLIATHRLSGLEAMDEIVVLDHGRVIQRGPHADLVARPGYYREAWLAERLAEHAAAPALR